MWTKALYELGFIGFDEPFKKLVNQGMIQGSSRFVYRLATDNVYTGPPDSSELCPEVYITHSMAKNIINGTTTKDDMDYVQSKIDAINLALKAKNDGNSYTIIANGALIVSPVRVDISFVDGIVLDIEAFKKWRPDYANAHFILEEDGQYLCGAEVEKMSKSKYNVVNPDDIIAQYGADTFRMYEMFLGPLDVSKPWDTKGIEGVHRFLRKFWRLYNDDAKGWIVTDDAAIEAELKVLHKGIKKIEQDTERFSLNTAVSQFMIIVNELSEMNCHKRSILEPLVQLICPYAPHIAEELWAQLGKEGSVITALFPHWEERYTTENSKVYPVAINGKTRTELEFALDASQADIEQIVLANEVVQKWLEGNAPKKIIFVKGKMINIVL
jgi:leucyl-tRNA synthetase